MDWDIPTIIEGYAQGYFLMADDADELGWYSSRERALIPLDDRFHYPKSLQRVLNQNRFQTAVDRDFLEVCRGCAARESTWISQELIKIYLALHQAGWAHSFETWQDEQLAGEFSALLWGGAFIGESMFYHIQEGSKVAMVRLVEHLRQQSFVLFDAQINNPHLERFGAYTINARDYRILLRQALVRQCRFL